MKIPDKVVMFCREYERVELMNGEFKKVMPTYPAHEYSKARMAGGEKWSNNSYGGGSRKVGLFRKDERENIFHGLYLHRLEIRGEGGRAYKVAVEGIYYVDLREDQLLDIMQNAGIQKGGYIDDDFCFATIGSDFRIIRVGSAEYTELKSYDSMPKASSTNMRFGSICKGGSNNRETFIYLGNITSNNWTFQTKTVHYGNYSWNRSSSEVPVNPLVWIKGDEIRSEVWINPYSSVFEKACENGNTLDLSELNAYNLSFPKSSKRTYIGEEIKLVFGGKEVTNLEEFIEAWNKKPHQVHSSMSIEYGTPDDYRIRQATPFEKKVAKVKVK